MDGDDVIDGTAQKDAGVTETLYQMPWSNMFPLGITSAVIGIAEGALAAHLDYQRERVGAQGTAIKDDPYVLFAIGEAAADINAARPELLANVDRMWDMVEPGRRSPSRTAPPAAHPGPPRPGVPCAPSTRSSPAPAATRCAWTSRCSASGATPTPASHTRSTCPSTVYHASALSSLRHRPADDLALI